MNDLQKAKDEANAAHAKRYENCMDYRDESESLKLCVADLNKAISEHLTPEDSEPESYIETDSVEVFTVDCDINDRPKNLRAAFLSTLIFLLSFIPFSSFAGDCETPDFSHFPVHVCEYLTDNFCIAKKIEHL